MLITILILNLVNLFMIYVVGAMVSRLTTNEGFTKLIERIEELEKKNDPNYNL